MSSAGTRFPDRGKAAAGMPDAGNRPATLSCRLTLPDGFRAADILSFHRRDPEEISERVEASALHKGLVWRGRPACLHIRFGRSRATATLAVDGEASDGADQRKALRSMVRRMLGLDQGVEAFERRHRKHPELGALIAANPGLRVPVASSPFEALSWAIIGQQISLGAAVSVRRRVIQAAGPRHGSGLWCYPDADAIAAMEESGLREAGLSASKARSLLSISEEMTRGRLPLDDWIGEPPVDEVRDRLLAIRGIGPWTVNYALLRGYGWLDGSLHGDLAVRRNLGALLGRDGQPGEEEAREWLAQFSPWRALVASHLWARGSTM